MADALHTAATATGSRALRGAADTYDRASRSPHGKIPRHTPEGNQLRTAARLLAMTDGTPGDGRGHAGALAGNLVGPDRCSGRATAGPGARRPSRRCPHGRRAAFRDPHRCPDTPTACQQRRPDLPGPPQPLLNSPCPWPTSWLRQCLQALLSSDPRRRWPSRPAGRGPLGKTRPRGLRPTRPDPTRPDPLPPLQPILAPAPSHLRVVVPRSAAGAPPGPALLPWLSRHLPGG